MNSVVYTPEQSLAILKAFLLTCYAVQTADVGKKVEAVPGQAEEQAAYSKIAEGAVLQYPMNSIIQAGFFEGTTNRFGTTPPPEIKRLTPANAVERTLTAIKEVIGIVSIKSTKAEVQEYKLFLYTSAEQIAKAFEEKSSVKKISGKEGELLKRLKAALGV